MSLLDLISHTYHKMHLLRNSSDLDNSEENLEQLSRDIDSGIATLSNARPGDIGTSLAIVRFFLKCIDELYDDVEGAKNYSRIILQHIEHIEMKSGKEILKDITHSYMQD